MDPNVGWLLANASVRTDVTGASLKEFLSEFRKIKGGDITPAEVMKATSSERTDVVDSMATLGGVLSVAMNLNLNGRPFSALGQDLERLRGLDAATLNAMVNAAIPLDRGLVILVGDKKKILPQLEGLGLPAPEDAKL